MVWIRSRRSEAMRLHRILVSDGVQVGITLVNVVVAERKRQRGELFVLSVDRPGDLR
jgi:hypothetical protein